MKNKDRKKAALLALGGSFLIASFVTVSVWLIGARATKNLAGCWLVAVCLFMPLYYCIVGCVSLFLKERP